MPRVIPNLAIQTLTILVALGVITVILGGIAILAGYVSSGRLLIALGGGAGFMGLLIAIGYSAITLHMSILTHFEYWTGAIVSVIADCLARRGESV